MGEDAVEERSGDGRVGEVEKAGGAEGGDEGLGGCESGYSGWVEEWG